MNKTRNIAVLTVARSDFGRLLPTLKLLELEPQFHLKLLVSGNHCQDKFGNSIAEVEANGFTPTAILEAGTGSESEKAARILELTGKWLTENKTDYLILLGDRYEMLAAAQAAILTQVPIIHIGGGYQTTGAIDDQIRQALTSLSKYHIVASKKCQERVLAIGAPKQNVQLFGAPDLEILSKIPLQTKPQFCLELGLDPNRQFCLITFHPETGANFEQNKAYMKNVTDFLSSIDQQLLITAPCADPGASSIFKMIDEVKNKKPNTIFIENLGIERYVNAMRHSVCMIGNSSSGIIESASMNLAVLNIGCRQGGREQSGNVINTSFELHEMSDGFKVAISESFQERCQTVKNVYGEGDFSRRFIDFLKKSC